MGLKKLAIVQSNYIPWKGYFDLIHMVDEFILYDDVQYTRRDWRNRNLIKTSKGPLWITIPVLSKGRYEQKINEARVGDSGWTARHWASIVHHYSRARYFKECRDFLQELYLGCRDECLSRINFRFIEGICRFLGIQTKLVRSSDYRATGAKTERLVQLCREAGAGEYLSGPAAKAYLDEGMFARAGIGVRWMDYGGYPEYRQLFPPFIHQVSIIDLILNEGPNAPRYMKSFSRPKPA